MRNAPQVSASSAGERVGVQRLPGERRAEGLAARRVGRASARPRRMAATAQTLFHMRVTPSIGSIARVPFTGSPTSSARVPSSISSAVGTLRVPSLSLRRSTRMRVQAALGVAQLDVEHREALAARGVALGPRERERHLRGDRRGEPLATVQPPGRAVLHGARLGTADVRSAGGLGHPLPAGPERRGIARGQVRHGARDQRLVARLEQRARRAVGHRERAGVDVRRRMEEIHLRELLDARVAPVGALVGRRDEAVAQREPLGLAPQRRHLDRVDPVAPGVPLHEARLVEPVGELQPVELAAGDGAELVELGLEVAQHVGRQHAPQPAAEQRVVAVLVAEFRARSA